MKKKKITTFSVYHHSVMGSSGSLATPLPEGIDNDRLIQFYTTMLKTRLFDKKAVHLQRTGQLGTYPSSFGQEAVSVGAAYAMRTEDIFCPYYRETGGQLVRGVLPEEILLYWGGDERGNSFKHQPKDFPIAVPIGTQTLHAAGAAFALQYQKKPQAVVTILGDGATSRGDFYEAMNISSVWNLPVIYVITNNEWAISTPRHMQTGSETLAQKSIGVGLDGVVVDGNDIVAVYTVVKKALEKAYTGGGATVIEARTYRMSDHTTADDASKYRLESEKKLYEGHDPLLRLKNYLLKNNVLSENCLSNIEMECQSSIDESVKKYLDTSIKHPISLYSFLYESIPKLQKEEYESIFQEETS